MKNYIICAPKYSKSNGVRVLYKLAEKLEKKGYKVFVFSVPVDGLKYNYITEITEEMRQNDVVIYPEIIYGNPLKFQNVVRYILYYPGKNGGQSKFDDYEIPFVFERKFYQDAPLLTISGMDESIFYKDDTPKDIDCYYVYKGGKWKNIPEFDNMIEINRTYPKTRVELGNLLRRTKTLYSYDDCSLLLDEARLCGCDIKIVTQDGFEDFVSEYDTMFKDSDNQLENFIKITQNMNYTGQIPKFNFSNLTLLNKLKYFEHHFFEYLFRSILKNNELAQVNWFKKQRYLSETKNYEV